MLRDNPEDMISERGATRTVFRELYSRSDDPWFGKESNAEKIRMSLTEATVRKYIDESDTVLDFGSGNRLLTDRLPGFVTGIDLAFNTSFDISQAFQRTYDCVCSFNVLCYYDQNEWTKMLWDFHASIGGGGYCIVCLPIMGSSSVDLDTFKLEFSKLFEILEEQTVVIDWHEDFEYRESLQYYSDLMEGLGEPTQTLLVGRKI